MSKTIDGVLTALSELGIRASEAGKNLYRVDTDWGVVMYYPAKGFWQHKGRNYHGDAPELKAWLKKQGLL